MDAVLGCIMKYKPEDIHTWVNSLNKSGVIDSEYLNEVNTLIHGRPEQQGTTQQAPSINSLDYNFGE